MAQFKPYPVAVIDVSIVQVARPVELVVLPLTLVQGSEVWRELSRSVQPGAGRWPGVTSVDVCG